MSAVARDAEKEVSLRVLKNATAGPVLPVGSDRLIYPLSPVQNMLHLVNIHIHKALVLFKILIINFHKESHLYDYLYH